MVKKIDKDIKSVNALDYYIRTCKCLSDSGKMEEYIFFKLGVELAVREKELLTITFKQVDLDNLVITGIENIKDAVKYYPSKNITKGTGELIKKHLSGSGDERLFKKSADDYRKSIIESIGDEKFTNHMMRHIGISFELNGFDMAAVNLKR